MSIKAICWGVTALALTAAWWLHSRRRWKDEPDLSHVSIKGLVDEGEDKKR